MRMQPEERECVDFVHLFGLRWPQHRRGLLHLANERRVSPGRAGMVTHAMLVRMGFRKGASDYLLTRPVGLFAGLWLEMKAPGGVLSEEQSIFLAEQRMAGYAACVTWGCAAAVSAVALYLGGGLAAVRFRDEVLGFPATEPIPAPGYGPVGLDELTLAGVPRTRRRSKLC